MKKCISLFIALLVLLFSMQVCADADSEMTLEKAWDIMVSDDDTLEQLKEAEIDALRYYREAVDRAERMNPEGYSYTIGGKEYFREYDTYTKISFARQKHTSPEQARMSYESAQRSFEITKRNMLMSLRSQYLDLANALFDMQEKQQSLNQAAKKYEADKKKFALGLLSQIAMEEATYNYTAALNRAKAAKRRYENACRRFNLFVGAPIDTIYTSVPINEEFEPIELKPVDEYMESALAMRGEIRSLEDQIKIKEIDLSVLDQYESYKKYPNLLEQYERSLEDIEKLKLQLDDLKARVEYEIRTAYSSLERELEGVKAAEKALNRQKSATERARIRYQNDLITKEELENAEAALVSAEFRYKTAIYSCNTKIMKFVNAVGIGPSF